VREYMICVDFAECPHKGIVKGKAVCLINVHIPNGLHNDCKAQRFPNRKEKVTFT